MNTTAGIAGLFDPATRWGIWTYRQDVGLAFARWGAGPGFYLMIPFLGPSSGRDALGRLFDMALNPLTYVPGAPLLFNVNAFSDRVDGYEALTAGEPDIYLAARALWAVQREIDVQDFEISEEDYAASDPEPSLGILLLKVHDSEFPGDAVEGTVTMSNTGRELPYSVWLQDHPAPLLFILPGIGAHRGSRL